MANQHAHADATLANRTEGGQGAPACFGLMPCAIVALGAAPEPTERMMNLQSRFYRFIVMLEEIRLPKLRPSVGKKHLERTAR